MQVSGHETEKEIKLLIATVVAYTVVFCFKFILPYSA